MSDHPMSEMLVDGAWLEAHLNDPNLRIVDCGSRDAFLRAHIPGAVVPADANFKDTNPERSRFVMPPDQFVHAMAALGIGDETEVVAYDAAQVTAGASVDTCQRQNRMYRVANACNGWALADRCAARSPTWPTACAPWPVGRGGVVIHASLNNSRRQVIPTADRTKATVQVKVTILDKDKDLKPEMSAKVTFLEMAKAAQAGSTAPAPAVVSVAKAAVVNRDGRPVVFEVREGKARSRPDVVGPERSGQVVVREGLSGGETLVSNPPETLKDGDAVRVKGCA